MDSIVIDVTALPPESLHLGSLVDLVGLYQDIDAVARQAGTIGYEILTSLGGCYHRRYAGNEEF
jgi:alanine racemase